MSFYFVKEAAVYNKVAEKVNVHVTIDANLQLLKVDVDFDALPAATGLDVVVMF